ncbi:uncharacterized protein BO87DRAFT_453150 [Aspergillus neoniger CBS 115656]|uniref:Uncharacterized protein n=1 Tax=Aspergillus neoniger (strain CBS 115656) TaxID=1448310 RepID=A0A318Y420_ASPNB|nr:hypothetical protein BO87DRAFT_453150 [Aspergillus neoniger CBS 115656]PYH28197.1 hypothetical protein BO87DRAFT_453150 [Aspergillus neoniger CBS 115656]
MGYLSASGVAALHAALELQPSESVRRHFLHPLRDVDPTMQIFQSWFRDDCYIFMIGPDTLLLKERIQNPEAYYQHYHPRKPQLEAWIVGIPPTSQSNYRARAERVTRLKKRMSNKRKDMKARAKALIALDKILLHSLRQCMCLYDREGPDANTFAGDSIQAKYFDLIHCSDTSLGDPVGLSILGTKFRLPWHIKRAVSLGDHWAPKDGMPYIDLADPLRPQYATANCTYWGSPRKNKNYGDRDAALVFNWPYSPDIDERWMVTIPTNVFRE